MAVVGEPPFALKKEEKEGSNKIIKSAQPRQLSWRRRGGQSNPQRRRLPADSDETSLGYSIPGDLKRCHW